MVSCMPSAVTTSITQPMIPAMPARERPLFLPISRRFHFVTVEAFRKRPRVVREKFVFRTVGTSVRSAWLAGSFRIFRQESHVTAAINSTLRAAAMKTTGSSKWVNSTVASGTTPTLKVAATLARNGYQYRCIVTDAEGGWTVSAVATLTVVAAE